MTAGRRLAADYLPVGDDGSRRFQTCSDREVDWVLTGDRQAVRHVKSLGPVSSRTH